MALLHCELYSQALRMPTSVTIILPHDITRRTAPAPALYLLHGRSHNHSVWQRYTAIEQYCQPFHGAIIMPEVNRSFYTDMAYGVDYFTYLTEELPALCESMFHIGTDCSHRYIAGMSMGGYGSLKAALSKPDFYRGCAAISAVTDICKHVEETAEADPKKREFRGIFGPELVVPEKENLYKLAQKAHIRGKMPDLYFSCGTEDHLYQEGADFRSWLSGHGISFTYEEWSGIHDWGYWDTAIRKVLEYFWG